MNTCILCGEAYEGYGHNPAPLHDYQNARCCDDCNTTQVIPARIELLFNKSK
jgi:hypothetical protein